MKYSHTIETGLDVYFIDGRTRVIPTQEYLDYRKDELNPELINLLKKAWEKGHTVHHSAIDSIISMQAESFEKAKRYIGYEYLGTHSYLDVFGKKAEEEYRWQRHEKQNSSMQEQLENMQKQMWDMQKLLLNFSKGQQSNFVRKIV